MAARAIIGQRKIRQAMKSPIKLPKTLRAGRRPSSLPVIPLAALLLCLALRRLGAQTDPLDLWTSDSSGYGSRGIAYGNGQFVAVGATIQTSADGANWTSHPTNLAQLYGITYGNGQYVAVGGGNLAYGAVITSADGATWTLRENGRQFGAQFGDLSGIAYGNGKFVAVGAGPVILTSADGANWTLLFPGLDTGGSVLNGVCYGNGQFVAVGEYGSILTSVNGTSWTERASGTAVMLFGAAYGNGQFVVVGEYGAILTSTDGATWTSASSGNPNDLFGIACGGGQFVGAGDYGAIVTSVDGTNWISRNSGTHDYLWGVAYGNAEFVVVGRQHRPDLRYGLYEPGGETGPGTRPDLEHQRHEPGPRWPGRFQLCNRGLVRPGKLDPNPVLHPDQFAFLFPRCPCHELTQSLLSSDAAVKRMIRQKRSSL